MAGADALQQQLFDAVHDGRAIETTIVDLLRQGAHVNWEDKDGMKPLALAAKLGNTQFCGFLLDNGAHINALSTERGLSALMFSAGYGKVETCHLLIARGSNLSLQDRGGGTALHWCAFTGEVGVVRLLLESGLDPTLEDNQCRTALDLAKAKGLSEMVALLETPVQLKPTIALTVADPHKRRREGDLGDSAEIQGLVEKAASAEEANLELEVRGREQGENDLRAALVRCANAEGDVLTLSAIRQEENRRFMAAVEWERQRTQEATRRALLAENRAVAAQESVDELRVALERSAIANALGPEEKTRLKKTIKREATCIVLAAESRALVAERLVDELRLALQRSPVANALWPEEKMKLTETIEREKQATQEATCRALTAKSRAVAAEKSVDELRTALERSATANAAGLEERRRLTEAIEREKQATQEASSRATEAQNLFWVAFEQHTNSEALRLEELKKFNEESERERKETQEAKCRAAAAEELVGELREQLAKTQEKLFQAVGKEYVVKQECP